MITQFEKADDIAKITEDKYLAIKLVGLKNLKAELKELKTGLKYLKRQLFQMSLRYFS